MADGHLAGPVLQITDLQTEIRLRNATVHAVDGVSLTVAAGECLGLVGESGSGKTMTARSVLRLLPVGGVITGGSVVLNGTELTNLSERSMEAVRGNDVGMVFQDPSSSLDPTMPIGRQIAESVIVHKGANRQAAAARAVEMLQLVRMPEPERVTSLHPHQLSGGMRQRAMIAAALACEPSLLIADEPTTALDVTIQREILELIDDLRAQLGMAVILVTHDLGVIAGRTERVAVMYGGRIIEQATTSALLAGPRHPYTEALFDALPEMAGPASRYLYSIPGRPPDLTAHTSGCAFAPRCRYARDWCTSREPALDGDHPGHTYACFFPIGVTAAAGAGAAGLDGWAGGGGGAVTEGTAGATFGADGRQPVSAWAGRWAGGSASGGPVSGFSTSRGPASGGAPAGGAGSGPDNAAEPLLRVAGLVKDYEVRRGMLRRPSGAVSAVAGVSFDLAAGQTFGLVGESGCGKTSIARLLVGLERATAGSIVLSGAELATLSARQRRQARAGHSADVPGRVRLARPADAGWVHLA